MPGTAPGKLGREPGELDAVSEALLVVQQDGPACRIGAVPGRRRQAMGRRRIVQQAGAPFVGGEARCERAPRQQAGRKQGMGRGVVRSGVDDPPALRLRLVQPVQIPLQNRQVHPGVEIKGIEGQRTRQGTGRRHAAIGLE